MLVPIHKAIEDINRKERGRILAALISHLKDFELAEDSLQDALIEALQAWPAKGLPDNPAAWLIQTASRKAIDKIRRNTNFAEKQKQLQLIAELEQYGASNEMDNSIPDERLRLIFTCCHPALKENIRVALTLQTLGGLTTSEIARAFLIPEPTMAQRIVRAKRKIKVANIPYRIPDESLWKERLTSVLTVIYFIFNEGYSSLEGESLLRKELIHEAIRLARMLKDLIPHEQEISGLLALMLLHDSRSDARVAKDGSLITLENQDRTSWNRLQIDEGISLLLSAMAKGNIGVYQIQAAISAIHAQASSYSETNWQEITLLYEKLYALQPNPIYRLNACVALSMFKGPEQGLSALNILQAHGVLETYQPFYVVKAELLRKIYKTDDAKKAYKKAIALTNNEIEKKHLIIRSESLY